MNSQVTPPNSRSSSFNMSFPAPRVNAFPNSGSFFNHPDAIMLKDMYGAIERLNLWNWLANYTVDEEKGIMFSSSPELELIAKETSEMGHSGASFTFCLRQMEYIAKNGWIDYYRNYIAPNLLKNIK